MTYEQLDLFPNEESSPQDSPARISQLPVPVLDWLAQDPACSGTLSDYLTSYTRSGSSSKTFPVSCQLTEGGTWEPSSGRWLSAGTGSRGGFSTLNISESRNAAVESSLSDVLEIPGGHLRKYFLSQRAASGILRRAEKRGRKLPEALLNALQLVAQQ
jgi:hypothetical protein